MSNPTSPAIRALNRAIKADRKRAEAAAQVLQTEMMANAELCTGFAANAAAGTSHAYDAHFRLVDPAVMAAEWKRKAHLAQYIASALTHALLKRRIGHMSDVAAWIVEGVIIADKP